MPSALAASWLGAAVVLAVPGPTNALLAAAGTRRDGRARWPLVAAVVGGYAISVTLLRLVGAPVAEAFPLLGSGLRLALAGYLLFLGCCLWRSRPNGAVRRVAAREVFVATLLNPKGLVVAFGLHPVAAGLADVAIWWLGFATLVAAASTTWIAVGHVVARDDVIGRRVTRGAGVVLAGFALVLGGGALASTF